MYRKRTFHFLHNRYRALGGSVPTVFLFLHFLSLSLIFLAAKHLSEDDNLKDGWLDRFSP